MASDKGSNPENETPDEDDEEFVSIEEEFGDLYRRGEEIKSRLLRIAKTKEENKQGEIANMYRTLASDILPWILESLSATAGTLQELEEGVEESAAETTGITEDDAVQIYVTLAANRDVLTKLKDSPAANSEVRDALDKVIAMNEKSMEVLSETYEDIESLAKETVEEATETEH